jgi:hypothetical protein
MMRVVLGLIAVISATVVTGQDSRPEIPLPPPPVAPPQGGTIDCNLRDSVDVPLALKGEIGWSAPRANGKRIPEVQIVASDPSVSGGYALKWTTGGAEFTNVDQDAQLFNKIDLFVPYYGQVEAVVFVRIESFTGGGPTNYVGFCKANFTQTGRNFE